MARRATVAKTDTGDPVRSKTEVKHEFTVEELREIGTEAARLYQQVAEKELAIKAASSSAKSEIKVMESRLGELMNKQTNGYEMRVVECLVEFRRRQGKKRLLWNAPGKPEHRKLIREEAMTEEDYQSLPLEVEPTVEEPQPAKEPEGAAAESAGESKE